LCYALSTRASWVGMETLRVIGDFYAQCESAQTLDEVAAALFEVAARAGFPHASYLCGASAAAPDTGLLLTNYPRKWRQRYIERRYHRIDPIIGRALRSVEPFRWSDPLFRASMSPRQMRMFDEAKAFRLGDGYAVPVQASIHVRASCFFASEHGDIDPASCKAMRRVSVIAHENVCRVARLSDGHGEAPALSDREGACLNLYAHGLDDSEIAAELGIRVPTVRRHLELVKQRLGVKTRPEALVRALLTGQIGPPSTWAPLVSGSQE